MRILIGLDGSGAAETACRFVASREWPIGTRVELVAGYELLSDRTGLPSSPQAGAPAEREALEFVVLERLSLLRSVGLRADAEIQRGSAPDLLLRRAAETFTDLIVVGSRGRGPIASVVLGSVSAHLVDHAPCPVLVARSPGASRMLLATDGTPSSRNIPRVLAAWANAFRGLPVEVLSVAPRTVLIPGLGSRLGRSGADQRDPDVELHARIAEAVADELMDLGWHAAGIARAGDPEQEILAAAGAWKADLIVTGSRGLGTLRRLVVGSVAHDLLMHAWSSLLVVRGQVPARMRDAVAVEGVATA